MCCFAALAFLLSLDSFIHPQSTPASPSTLFLLPYRLSLTGCSHGWLLKQSAPGIRAICFKIPSKSAARSLTIIHDPLPWISETIGAPYGWVPWPCFTHYSDVTWASWRLNSLENPLFDSLSRLTPKETRNSSVYITGHLWGESTADQWIPLIKGQ